jgi:hypothetical protein
MGLVDPSENVKSLSEASNVRQDDLREAERRYNDLRAEHQKEIASLRAQHQEALDKKESARLDSIRQVDREDVAKTAAQANLAIATLAKQTTDLATTLQAQVGSTAAAAETRRSADMSEVNKRVSALELASSATAGKQTVVDPQMAELTKQVAALAALQAAGAGQQSGGKQAWGYVFAVIGALIGITGLAFAVFKP